MLTLNTLIMVKEQIIIEEYKFFTVYIDIHGKIIVDPRESDKTAFTQAQQLLRQSVTQPIINTVTQ